MAAPESERRKADGGRHDGSGVTRTPSAATEEWNGGLCRDAARSGEREKKGVFCYFARTGKKQTGSSPTGGNDVGGDGSMMRRTGSRREGRLGSAEDGVRDGERGSTGNTVTGSGERGRT